MAEDQSLVSLNISSDFSDVSTRIPSYLTKQLLYKVLFVVVLLPLSVFLLAFFLQWRGSAIYMMNRRSIEVPEAGMSFLAPSQPPDQVNPSKVSEEFAKMLAHIASPVLQDNISQNSSYNGSSLGPSKICITSTTSATLKRLLPWIFYHKAIGIGKFFLFVEGKAANITTSKVLESIPGVQVIYRTKEFEEQQAKSRFFNDTRITAFINKPCNRKLFLKQLLNMEMGVDMARDAGMEWIFHLDTDELLHPAGTKEYSMIELLSGLSKDVDTVVFLNHEAAVERDDIKEPFTEVSMFKKNLRHLPKDLNRELYREATRSNPSYFFAYGNGKSGARIKYDLRPNGAHRWEYQMKIPKEVIMNEAAILHYTFSRFSDLTSRRDRCHCKLTKEDLEKCFFLPFDRSAYVIASNSTQPEMLRWYQEHVVWNDEVLKLKLLKAGILTRIYAPTVIIRTLVEQGVFASAIASANAPSPSPVGSPNPI